VKKTARTKPAQAAVYRRTCTCGSNNFRIEQMSLLVENAPLEILPQGRYVYNDTAGSSSGWNPGEDFRVSCAMCKKEWAVVPDGDHIHLEEVE